MINTKKVTDRRTLRFETLDQAVADAEALAAADAAGALRKAGNWSLGQAVSHVAFWANAPFDGYPSELKTPWLMRKLLGLMRGRILTKGMFPGVKIAGAPGGTYGAEEISSEEACVRLVFAFGRLDSQCPADPNPLFGSMTHGQWRALNLRHAELHFSFFHPG